MTINYCDICGERQEKDSAFIGELECSAATSYIQEMPMTVIVCICPSCMRKIISREVKT